MASNKLYKITVTLLEDLHSGTGTGNALFDAVQARNEEGYPIIDRHHFRGVMKDNAERLCNLGALTKSECDSLFGKGGNQQRKLDCSSLTAIKKDCINYWESTARQTNSRCPEENSLRRIEYIKSDSELKGELTLNNVEDNEIDAFKKVLKFTTRLGGERTRGSGQIKIDYEETTLSSKPTASHHQVNGNTLKILLCNKEPLCIPKSGHAGNIIHTESFIPGRTLFAALASIAHKAGKDTTLKELFNANIRVGNAYPIPKSYEKQSLKKLSSQPMPNQIHTIKQGNKDKKPSCWPHWAKQEKEKEPAPQLEGGQDIDLFMDNTEEKTSRPKGEIYLLQDKQGKWRRYTQALTIRMRNQRGHFSGKKTVKGEEEKVDILRKDTELFSEQRIPENTHFIAEIHCNDDTAYLQTIAQYLQQPMYIGRGKAPIVCKGCVSYNSDPTDYTGSDSLTITATSDWILRGENLGYLTALNKHTLLKAFGVSKIPDNIKFKAYQETEEQGSFNYATQMPKRPFYVIRRGSSYRLTGTNEDIEKIIKQINDKPIGERTQEGYGQFVINADIAIVPREVIQAEKQERVEQKEQEKEKLNKEKNEQKKKLCQEYIQLMHNKKASIPPDKEQWEQLKQEILANDKGVAYATIVSGAGIDCLYREMAMDNLGRKLDDLSIEGAVNIEDYLNCLELHFFSEEEK